LQTRRSPQNGSGTATNPSHNWPDIGHEGIAGNETADQLARTVSEQPFTGPEPACGISVGVVKKVVRDEINRSQKIFVIRNWTQTGKKIILGPSAGRTKDLLTLIRDQSRWVVGLFTGHCHLKNTFSDWD
jgi:hypothetical protein